MKAPERIGLFICECGPNIKDAVDLDGVAAFARRQDDVVLVRTYGLLCSSHGQALIEEDIQEHNLSRVVVAACSPKEHEKTFREILKNAGLNPFLLQIVNIREQCAWVVTEKILATDKAKAMIRAAVKRVVHHEPLEIQEMACQSDVLVVGAGISGMSAALALAQKNRKVYLVEKQPCIGGKVARYEDLFPGLECASCILDPRMDEVLNNEQIEVLTFSDVQEVLGFYGNFLVKVNRQARLVDPVTCLGCGACFDVCPVAVENEYNEGLDERKAIYIPYAGSLPNVAVIDRDKCLRWRGEACEACKEACPFGCIDYEEDDQIRELNVGAVVLATGFDIFDAKRAPRYGYGRIDDVYTSLEFERLVNSTGPTEGSIRLKNGESPRKIALVHCVGSRTAEFNEHCSGVCCSYLLKFAHQAAAKVPGASIAMLYSDLCLPDKDGQGFFNRIFEEDGPQLLHLKAPDALRIDEDGENIRISYTDIHGDSRTLGCDMVVLAPAMEGAKDAPHVADVFDVALDKQGFFVEAHRKMDPVSTLRDGVFVAGCARGPQDIQASVAQGQAAAGMILSRLVPGEMLALEAMTAEVNGDLCSGCKVCISLCPFKAITCDDITNMVSINQILCRGCGVCPAACPSGAIEAHHFTDAAISAEIKGLVQSVNPDLA